MDNGVRIELKKICKCRECVTMKIIQRITERHFGNGNGPKHPKKS